MIKARKMDNLHSKLEDLINELDEEHINKSLSDNPVEVTGDGKL